MRKLLCISYLGHKTNDWVQSKISLLVGPQEPLLATVKRWKLAWSGHVTRHNILSKPSSRHCGGWWCCGWQRKCWMDHFKEWTSLPMPELLTRASCRKDWKMEDDLCWIVPHVSPMTELVKGLNWTELNGLCWFSKVLRVEVYIFLVGIQNLLKLLCLARSTGFWTT